MILHVMDSALVYKGTLQNYRAIRWSESYQGVGSFSLTVDDTDKNVSILTHGSYLYRKDRPCAMIVVQIVRNGEQKTITASGYTCLSLLSRRVKQGLYTLSNVESGLYSIVGTAFSDVPTIAVASAKPLSETWNAQVGDSSVQDIVLAAVKQVGLGARMNFDVSLLKHQFEVYKGVSREYQEGVGGLVFSTEFGNLVNITINEDDDVYKNVAVVMGKKTDNSIIYVTVGSVTGLSKREVFIDGGSQTSTEALADFQTRLSSIGSQELAKRYMVRNFSAEIKATRFGVDFDLGDKITCNSTRYGVRFDTRITAFSETIDNGVRKISVTLGEPSITYLQGALIKNG